VEGGREGEGERDKRQRESETDTETDRQTQTQIERERLEILTRQYEDKEDDGTQFREHGGRGQC